MKIPEFKLEEFWKKYEFTAPYLLCCSDAESWSLQELLEMADAETKEMWAQLRLGYTESPGHPILREEIAHLYTSLQAADIITLAGAEEGIYCTMRVLLEPGDHVVCVTPAYQSLTTLPEVFGAEVSQVQLSIDQQWKLNVREVEAVFRTNTKLLVLNYPHNPTGAIPDHSTFHELVKLARKHGAYIFCDEVYRYIEMSEQTRLPSIADIYEKGISLNVMTKSFGLAGLRIGWLATRDTEFIKNVGSYKLFTSICNSAPSEILAIIALRAKERILQRNRDIVSQNLAVLAACMQRHADKLRWVPPSGGTMATIQLRLPIKVEKFADDLLRDTGVLIMPGSVFDLPGNFFRVGLGRRNMPEILGRFEAFLEGISH